MLFNIACNGGGNQIVYPLARIVRLGGQRANLGGADRHQGHLQWLKPPLRIIIWIESGANAFRLLTFCY